MLFVPQPCPNCGAAHGKSTWLVLNSSIYSPLQCQACKENFHQAGHRLFFIAAFVSPLLLAPIAGFGWATALIFIVLVPLVLAVYTNRFLSLLPGSTYS